MTLSKEKRQQIKANIQKTAENLTNKQQEMFVDAAVSVETTLNEGIDDLLNNYRNEIAPFILGLIPLSPGKTNEIIETTAVEVKKVLQEIMKTISITGDAGIKVIMCETIKQGINLLKESSIQQHILMKRVLGEKET